MRSLAVGLPSWQRQCHTRAADYAIASVVVGVDGLDESGTSTVDGLHGDVGVAEQRRNEAVRLRTSNSGGAQQDQTERQRSGIAVTKAPRASLAAGVVERSVELRRASIEPRARADGLLPTSRRPLLRCCSARVNTMMAAACEDERRLSGAAARLASFY